MLNPQLVKNKFNLSNWRCYWNLFNLYTSLSIVTLFTTLFTIWSTHHIYNTTFNFSTGGLNLLLVFYSISLWRSLKEVWISAAAINKNAEVGWVELATCTYRLSRFCIFINPYFPKVCMSSKTNWYNLSFGIAYLIAELPNMLVFFYIDFMFREVSLYDYFRNCSGGVAATFEGMHEPGINFHPKQKYPVSGFILNFSIICLFTGALLFSIKVGGL